MFIAVVSCKNNTARKPLVRKTSSFLQESVSYNKALISEEEALFKEIIKRDSLHNYTASTNGFWYKAEQKDSLSYLPKYGDQLSYTYEVYSVDFNLIYSFEEVGEKTYFVDQQDIIEGLRDGLKLMSEGDTFTFLFPSHKVFGYLGDQNKITINQPLIYKVQLNKIKRRNESN
jgi:gliding motility-associated peptidyl-prolyl isomerase